MSKIRSESYRAFVIEVDVADEDGASVKVMRMTIGIKGQRKRIPIAPDSFAKANFASVDQAFEASMAQARRTIDQLLDAQQG